MSTIITSSPNYMPLLCRALDYTPTALATCIVCADAETLAPVAGVVYDGYNGAIIHAHIWIGGKPSREWMAAIFDYPFNRCEVNKIIGQVCSDNLDAIRLDEHFGFVREAEVENYYPSGASLLVYTMTKEQCRVLTSTAWRKVNNRVMGVK